MDSNMEFEGTLSPVNESTQNLISTNELAGNNGIDCMPIGLSPVQIQQEYFENLGDGDWVNLPLIDNLSTAQKQSIPSMDSNMEFEGTLSPVNESTQNLISTNELAGNNGIDCMPIGLSPVQIQQEYFENLGDGDWVNLPLIDNLSTAQKQSIPSMDSNMEFEGTLSPVNESTQNLISTNELAGNNGIDCMPIGLSPVQIQQEYFENLGDGDWVNLPLIDNLSTAQKQSIPSMDSNMEFEGTLSPVNESTQNLISTNELAGNNGIDCMPIGLSPVQIQQEYFENLGDGDWVKYEKSNRNYLLQNVAFALFGSPSSEGDLTEVIGDQNAHLEGYTSRQKEQVMKVYEKLCEQSKYSYNNDDTVMSVLLVVCARPKPLKFFQMQPADYWVDLHQRNDIDLWCTAVFRVRKCIPTTVGASCCKVYIDENARVYQDWDSYLLNNTLPKCVLIVPQNGEYNGTIIVGQEAFAVKLSVVPSPSLGVKARVLSTVDTASTVASLGAIGVLGVAAFTPVGPAVLAGAAVATVATGVYGLVRSSLHLRDRSTHQQSISPTDAEARGSWLNIAASSVGLAAGAASTLLTRSAVAGTNLTKTGQALAVSVEVLRHANIVTGGAGVVNSLVHIILKFRKHGEKPTKLELFQFTAATLFFCNAVISTRTAQNIVEDAQARTINDYRDTLRSNKHRKMFDKISAESRRVQGAVQGNTEVIKGIKNIIDKDQYFADVLKINKDLNQHKLRISMSADGQVNLNAQHRFNPSELYSLGKEGRSQLFTSLGPAALDSANVPTRVMPLPTAVGNYVDREEEGNMLVGIHPGEIIRIGTLLVRVSASGAENVALMLENLSQDVYANLMTVSFNVLSKLVPEDISRLRLLSPDEDLIVQIVNYVFNYMKHQRPMGEPCRNTDNGIVVVLKEFFQEGVVRQDTILYLKDRLLAWIEEETDRRRLLFPNKRLIICEKCHGVRYGQ